MKVRLIFGCGFFIDKDINVVNAPEVRLILRAACIHEFTVIRKKKYFFYQQYLANQ